MNYEEFKKICRDHNLKIWFEKEKNRYCIYGQAGTITRCLKATRKNYIIINSTKYSIEEISHQIYQMSEIKIAFEKIE